MSTGSELYVEILRNDQWHPIPEPQLEKGVKIPVPYMNDTALYELYAALIGYERRSTYHIFYSEPIIPLSQPRDFPDDMNQIFRDYLSNFFPFIGKLYTWFMLQDLLNYDWDRTFPPFTGYVKHEYASLFSQSAHFPDNFPDGEHVYAFKKAGMTEVSWIESYRDFVGYVDWFLEQFEELLRLGDPTEVRIIYGMTY